MESRGYHGKRAGGMRVRTVFMVALLLAASSAHSQDDSAGAPATQLDPITVTGTRMKRVDQEDLQPLIVITREELDASGQTSIAGVLRNLTQNSFGPTTDRAATSLSPGSTTVNLRGQGAQYTLVLLNGVPLVGEPSLNGDVQNLNVLPWAAVDRIEILDDGASAIYGSQAIGGVINVITKQNFSGAAFSGQVDRPGKSGADTNAASAVIGFHDDRSQLMLSVDYSKSDPLFSNQRNFLPPQFSPYGAPPTWHRDSASPDVDQAYHAAANCPSAIGTNPRYPNSQVSPVDTDGSTYCEYNFVADAQLLAALERKTLLGQGSTLLGDAFNVHAILLVTQNHARSELAAAPATGLADAIAADSPFNPTLGEVAPGVGYPLDLLYRPTPVGHRIAISDEDVQQLTAGIGGRRIGAWDADWNIDVTGTHYGEELDGRNDVSRSRLLQAFADGSFNPFADPSTQDFSQFTTAFRNTAVHRTQGVTAHLQPASFSLFGVPLDVLGGVDYTHETLQLQDDPLVDANDIVGNPPGTPTDRTRNYHAFFSEFALNPNGRWQIKAAIRRDDYSDGGAATSPKLAVMWKATDSLLLRASIGKGFHVPDLVTLSTPPSLQELQIPDLLGCQLRPNDPIACSAPFRQVLFYPNPSLGPETARQISVGIVYSPTPDFSAGVQAFRTRFSNAITSLDPFAVIQNDIDCHQQGRACDPDNEGLVQRGPDGEITQVLIPQSVNAASSLSRGFDVNLRVAHDFDIGRVGAQLAWSRLTQTQQRFPGGETDNLLGYLGSPRDRVNLGVDWRRGAWSAAASAHLIGAQRNCDYYDTTSDTCTQNVPRYATVDAQIAWSVTDRTTLSLGARNLADRQPFIDYNGSYGAGLYDAIGRVVYLRIEQRL
ncbi:MAG TPA: TonB-dependent receptor [Dokdonella sp.]